jgi:hypothetical protein
MPAAGHLQNAMTQIEGEAHAQRGRTVLALVIATGVVLGCSKEPSQISTGPADAANDGASVDQVMGGSDLVVVVVDSGRDIPPNTQPTPPEHVRFPDPPQWTCAAPTDCEFPPSACADPSCDGGACFGYSWAVYYDSPQCVTGKCVFEQRYFQCSGATTCFEGGCRFNGTAVP